MANAAVRIIDEEDGTLAPCSCYGGDIDNNILSTVLPRPRPIEVRGLTGAVVDRQGGSSSSLSNNDDSFWAWPWIAPLIFVNEASDCRDHCANERTFLSYLRLSIYLAVVSVAILVSFHLKQSASDLELRMAKPLGIVFSVLSIACISVGLANYIDTVNKYTRKVAIVQAGWKTQAVVGIVSASIVGSCITFLVVDKIG